MSISRPTFFQNFAHAPGILDPRATFTRATAGAYIDRMGMMKTAPAGMLRPRWHPTTGVPQGVMFEGARTNLWLYSEQLDNAANTKTSASISANSVAAPDGATTADTITVSAASGSVNQAITATAGNSITLSAHFKQLTSAFARLRISDGVNTAAVWFNLAAGTVGSSSAGASTVVYSASSIEALANGWYRCQLTATTATSTSFTGYASCAAADATEPANLDSVYCWGLQIEQPGTTSAASSYIATTSASVTRNGDVLVVPTSASWFSASEGTMLIEWVNRLSTYTGVIGGFGDTFSNTGYLARASATSIVATFLSGAVSQAQHTKTIAPVDGQIMRAAIAWKVNDFAFAVDGAAPSTDTSGAVPVAPVRLGIGNAPWSASGGTQPGMPIRMVAYWPLRLADSVLQTITQ